MCTTWMTGCLRFNLLETMLQPLFCFILVSIWCNIPFYMVKMTVLPWLCEFVWHLQVTHLVPKLPGILKFRVYYLFNILLTDIHIRVATSHKWSKSWSVFEVRVHLGFTHCTKETCTSELQESFVGTTNNWCLDSCHFTLVLYGDKANARVVDLHACFPFDLETCTAVLPHSHKDSTGSD